MDKTLLIKAVVIIGVVALCVFILIKLPAEQNAQVTTTGNGNTVITNQIIKKASFGLNYQYEPKEKRHYIGFTWLFW